MNYSQFSKKSNILSLMLNNLGITEKKRKIIKLNSYPDYDISDYRREIDTDYYFYNDWDFKNEMDFIFDVSFINTKIFHFDDLQRASRELKMTFDPENKTQFINNIYLNDKANFNDYGIKTNFDQFKLKELRVKSINNSLKKVNYDGNFFGNYETFDPIDWSLYSLIEFKGLKLHCSDFHKNLIAESLVLEKENKYKLAYFLSYSALENFINVELQSFEEQTRLREKLNKMYKNAFGDISKHQIYTSVINDYKNIELNRNNIAHGNNNISITKSDYESMLLFICSILCSYELQVSDFKQLFEKL